MAPPAFLTRQSPDEIARQFAVLAQGRVSRAVLTLIAFALSGLFLPVWVVALAAALDLGIEHLGLHLMRGLNPATRPLAYFASLACVAVVEMNYAVISVLVFHVDSPFSKAFATGTLTLTMLQLVTMRTIHVPYAMTGLVTVLITVLAGVAHFWWGRGDALGAALMYLALLASAYFVFQAMIANHRLHDGAMRGQAAAQAADAAKSRFLAQMSHELRTPLNAILGLGHAELAAADNPGSRERLELMVSSAQGLAVILDDILDMSAIEAGALPIRPAPANPAAEIRAVLALFQPVYQSAGLRLELEITEPLPPLALFDAQRLRQCLTNLLSNAAKHTAAGGVSVTARIAPPGMLAIEVADTGSGIDPESAGRLFEAFQRGDLSRPGTGLGLPISRSLARAMGGDLALLPSAKGARFGLTVALPALPAPAPVPTENVRLRSGRYQVLVVDDIATNRLVARALLRLFHIEAREAADGAAALAALGEGPADLVFLDMNMPGLDGLATLSRIRALPGAAGRVPVVAMTADASDAQHRGYLAAGLDGYLAKPLTPEALETVLAQLLPV